MSQDIDQESFSGVETAPAAAEQAIVDTNSYQDETGDYPVLRELLEPAKAQAPQPAQAEPSEQDRNFQALRAEVDRIKAEREAEMREHRLQLEMLRANQVQQQQPQQRQEMFGDKDPTYLPNVQEIRQEWNQREEAYKARLEELEVRATRPDYLEVIDKYTAPLIKEKPHLAEGIWGSSNKALFAYELGKMQQQMQVNNQPQTPAAPEISPKAQRMVENSRKPTSLSQAPGQTTLSKADYYATMSDREFMQMASKHLESI